FRFFAADTILARQHLANRLRRFARRARIQLVAAPDHLDLIAMRKLRERRLKTNPADIAPRAGDVRPDLNLHAILPSQIAPTCSQIVEVYQLVYIYTE